MSFSIKNIIPLVFFALAINFCLAQPSYEPITIGEKGLLFKTKYFERCDIQMTPMQLFLLFKEDPRMSAYTPKLGLHLISSTILRGAGQALVLWPVAESLGGHNDPNWYLALIGAGCVALSIPFNNWFNQNAEKAVNFYNSEFGSDTGLKLNFEFGQNGPGLVMRF